VPERLRVAVIGLGAMGANHARVYGELPGAELVAVADRAENRLRSVGRAVHAYTDYRALLERARPDAVSIAVPTRLHLDVALACIERGLPVLVEKPLGADLAECLRLQEAAAAAGVPLMPGHIERFNPVVRSLKRHLEAGDYGRVYGVSVRRVGPFYERERDVGVVHDLATHDIDLVRWLFGEVGGVAAETQSGIRTPYEDALAAVLGLAGGVPIVLETNWLSAVKLRAITITAEYGTVNARLLAREIEFVADDAPERAVRESFADEPEALHAELATFLRVARREEPPPVTADDAIAAMRVVEALVESARRGETVHLAVEAAT
jgi:predicted dehydrogenase